MLKTRQLLFQQRRWKAQKPRWNIQQRKKTNIDRALENFDDFYGSVYGIRWKNMRAALLTEHKYVAMVNNFGDTEKTCSMLELDGAINIKSLVKLAQERLEQQQPLLEKTSTEQLSSKLDQLIRKQEDREKMSIYPETDEVTPQRIQYSDNDRFPPESSDNDEDSYKVDGKKSLEQALEEDSYIDNKRLVDPQFGTGGLYEYVPANKIKGMEDWIPESDHYKYYQTTTDFPLNIELEREFSYPENLHLYTYEIGNCSDFKAPRKCLTGVLSHYLMDGASILPPLFLDVKHGEKVLDACAAPGGKSLLMLQTMHPEFLVCNDLQESRINRIQKVMQEYLFDFKQCWLGKRVLMQQSDARNLMEYNSYDKILVDVPCTTDRHSVMESDNNIFKGTRIKERLRIPELQAGILSNCLRLLRPGGTLVYSTCSLSPVQNDGVVHMALQQAFNEHGISTTIKDLSWSIHLFADIFKFEHSKGLKYGQMVIPYLPANFGPMYFSKITRNN